MIRREFLRKTAGVGLLVGAATKSRRAFANAECNDSAPSPFPQVRGLTAYTADFVINTRYEDLPQNVIALGKKSILDSIGLALAGTRNETANFVHQYMELLGVQKQDATVIGTAKRYPIRFAAFANGVAIHTEDFDDTQLAAQKDRVYGLLTHPSVSVLPAIFAEAEVNPTTGKEWMTAYHVGVDVECKIAEAISPRSYEDGFHTTGTCGVFGGTAALAKLRRFDKKRLMNAMGVAAATGAGLRENFGTMTKPFTAGHSAESAVLAADLAQIGWTSADAILEAERGFFHAYGGGFEPNAIVGKLGSPWTIANPGVSIKPYPSGSLTHPGMTKMQELIRLNKINSDDVESIDVGTNHANVNALMRHHPTTGLEAKFSMEYSMAVLLVHGKAGLSEYTDAAVNQPAVQAMIKRVNFHTDSEADAAGLDKMTTIIKIRMKDGRTINGRADFGKGSPANPMSYEEVADKFQLCAQYVNWPTEKTKQIIEFVKILENAPDMRKLIALCSA